MRKSLAKTAIQSIVTQDFNAPCPTSAALQKAVYSRIAALYLWDGWRTPWVDTPGA
ncbi:hypothetical protein NOR51B_2222 [Luminiphilus syltensis NOR5-1B]|uniref:Uncharacterized protein n=1 Tax=Luminiphilus syltensis NOR5-1B TaxID=565045 RepID=B8KRC6_9GAMM|nr:hypothetical protein NOR51B_2222 [Luminiphilus syltensis NOR5-1B]